MAVWKKAEQGDAALQQNVRISGEKENRVNEAPSFRTLRELRGAFAELGFRPQRAWGQNFLVDLNIMRLVADAGELSREDVVLEVGAGTGSLTRLLSERAGSVVAVELDRTLCELARRQLAPFSNVRLIERSILDGDGRLDGIIMEAVREEMRRHGQPTFKLVSDLPFSIATPVLSKLILADAPVGLMAVTVQREVAERINAAPGTRAYGHLSVLVQATSRLGSLRRIPASAFWPRPKVDSALITLYPDPELRRAAGNLGRLMAVVGALFTFRRKTLLQAMLRSRLAANKEEAARLLAECNIAPDRRPETLAVQEWILLTQHLDMKKQEEG